MPRASKIFCGFRALGYVSNHVPLEVRLKFKEKENYVITCVGKAFHTYNCSKLAIISVSDAHPDDITCLAVAGNLIFTACQNIVRAFHRGTKAVKTLVNKDKDISLLLPFGHHLICVDIDSNVTVWDYRTEEIYLEMDFDPSQFKISAMVHPTTYLNKILIGSRQGVMQLWNIKHDKLLYSFTGWGQPINILQQAPAVDVVAVGLEDGQIMVHNIKYDETIVKFRQEWGPVTSVSFRTDGHPIMLTGSSAGHISLWDLEERKLKCQMRDCHHTSVTGMKCLQNEPLMVTSAADNTLKVWIFDMPDGSGRLLRLREGHSAPPNKVLHYDNKGHNILSAGQDSTLRSFSTIHDKHNKNLGRASFDKAASKHSGLKKDQYMMPPITDFTAESSRESEWDNIVSCHRGLTLTTTWNYQKSTMGKHKFKHERFDNEPSLYKNVTATAVNITLCGNFVLIGYSSGHVDKYNLQSGIYRGSYGIDKAHSCSIRGVVVDGLNQQTITAGSDGSLKFWKFHKPKLLESISLSTDISQILLHRESSMLAVVLDDFTISIVDIDTHREVRKFEGHSNRVTDLTFSPDARWLISGAMDASLRTWDLPTGKLVDCFLLDSAVTSVSLSPTGDFLVTTHVDNLGVYLWSNLTLYSFVSLRPLEEFYEPKLLVMPGTSVEKEDREDSSDDEEEEYLSSDFKSPEQIADELVTLSLLPNSRWQNLLSLDIIKSRNKPKEPPKKGKAAPFFLKTIAGITPTFDINEENKDDKDDSHLLKGRLLPLSDIGLSLSKAKTNSDYETIVNKFKELGPSRIEVEIRSLVPEGGGSVDIMVQFVKFINYILSTNKNFEIAQAYLGLFLKLHAEVISNEIRVQEELDVLCSNQSEKWIELQTIFTQCLCLINYLRTATV
ncbi:hypothetical protein LOTGIDRAFT_215492 [Lottia gigantea]|uniref:Uncharacterized protein n=1 Tax=Lottia gigantea TaxID=225164 RepID=V4AH55_LOTGI|nr:hypothetical protein LOTGIDRAFT_215492 [Lottia gigantea]ESO94510.1 hypothetical protein LOTGIDRAFT_215492 [Lottia gigantea]